VASELIGLSCQTFSTRSIAVWTLISFEAFDRDALA
jgi:hypothetical protein